MCTKSYCHQHFNKLESEVSLMAALCLRLFAVVEKVELL